MSDLLDKLGKRSNSAEGAGNTPEPHKVTASAVTSTEEHGRGDDLLARLGGKKSQENSAENTATSSAESGPSRKIKNGTCLKNLLTVKPK